MSELISLTDVTSNQILVWSDIEQAFVNVTASSSILNIEPTSHIPLSPNNNIISSITNNEVRTRGIVAGDNVTIMQTASDIIISVEVENTTDAETLSGFPHLAFVKKSELNSLIQVTDIQMQLDVYTKVESHDQFMETNASNIPDLDNTYDLGSNGRRYADVYAKTFHGTATSSMLAQNLNRMGATDNDVLTWDGDSWRPLPLGSISINTLSDVDISNVSDGQLLTYDTTTNSWINVDADEVIPVTNLQFNNIGMGEIIFSDVIEDTVRFKTIEANTGIITFSDENSIHIQIDDDYLDDQINQTLNDATISTFESIFNIIENNDNTMLVWDDGKIVNRPIPVGGGDGSIDTSNASPGQVLSYDGTNLVFVEPYNALDDIDISSAQDGYVLTFNGTSYELREATIDTDTLNSVDTSTAINGDILTWNGTEYILQNVNTLDNIDIDGAVNGYVITFEDGEYVLREPPSIGLTLDDLDVSIADDGYYVAYNGISYELRELPQNNITDNDTLGDVIVSGANVGDVLSWDGDEYILTTPSDTLKEIDTLNAQDGFYVAFNGVGYDLRELPINNGEPNTDLLADVDTSTAINGYVLTWNGSGYVLNEPITPSLSLNDLTDVVIDTPLEDQVLTWNGTQFTLQTFSAGSVTSLSELTDVDGTITPNDGDVLTYNSTKNQYEPLPFTSGSGTKYEILRVNYNASNNYDSVEYLTDNLEVVSVIDSDLVLLEVKFSNYMFPPLSIGYWGYVYTENMYRFINVTTAVSDMSISGVGSVGSPTLFDPTRPIKEYNMSVSVRTSESQASPSDGFPPQPTHAYVVFVMGD